MAFSDQNKKFLVLLNNLGIDLKQFPDKTFDGLFENVPEDMNYFFNWLIENITPDNVLTESEQALYFQLEQSQLILPDDEINKVLPSISPSFQDLMCLNINYVNNVLPNDLEDLTKNVKNLSVIMSDLESNHNDIKKKQNKVKEEVRLRKKQIEIVKKECENTNQTFCSKIDEVKEFISKDANFSINLNSFNNLLEMEETVFNKIQTCKLLHNRTSNSLKLDLLNELEEDMACVNNSLILSEGLLKEKKVNLEFLKELLQKKMQKNLMDNNMLQSYLLNNDSSNTKLMEDIKILENEIIEKVKTLSHFKIKTMLEQFQLEKTNLNKFYMTQLTICNDFVKSNRKMDLWLIHILLKCISSVENTLSLKKEIYVKLNEFERNFSNDLANLELKRQRFKEVSMQQNQHLLLTTLKDVMNLEENPENNDEAFKNIYELLLNAEENSNFATEKFRNDLQSSIKLFFNNNLSGPTSQVLLAPPGLMQKLQNCEEYEMHLEQLIKKLASKFVDAKALISKSERKKLLSWIEKLTNLKPSSK